MGAIVAAKETLSTMEDPKALNQRMMERAMKIPPGCFLHDSRSHSK